MREPPLQILQTHPTALKAPFRDLRSLGTNSMLSVFTFKFLQDFNFLIENFFFSFSGHTFPFLDPSALPTPGLLFYLRNKQTRKETKLKNTHTQYNLIKTKRKWEAKYTNKRPIRQTDLFLIMNIYMGV